MPPYWMCRGHARCSRWRIVCHPLNPRRVRASAVGLQNGKGQNVCFMNCLMQVLAHVCYAGKMKVLLDQIFSNQV
jgi:ubiquitin C-terminal hydrolase